MRGYPLFAILSAVALAALGACGKSSPTSPHQTTTSSSAVNLAGSTFDLVSIDHSTLPIVTDTVMCVSADSIAYPEAEQRITSMSLQFTSAEVALHEVLQDRCMTDDGQPSANGWVADPDSTPVYGTYVSTDTTAVFTIGAGQYDAVLNEDMLTIYFLPGIPYLYQRR